MEVFTRQEDSSGVLETFLFLDPANRLRGVGFYSNSLSRTHRSHVLFCVHGIFQRKRKREKNTCQFCSSGGK